MNVRLTPSVSVMSRIGGLGRQRSSGPEWQIQNQEYEFRIGSVSVCFFYYFLTIQLGDSLGIVLASIVSIPMQVALCAAQVQRGKDLCRQT